MIVEAIEVDGKTYTADDIRELEETLNEYDNKFDLVIEKIREMRENTSVPISNSKTSKEEATA